MASHSFFEAAIISIHCCRFHSPVIRICVIFVRISRASSLALIKSTESLLANKRLISVKFAYSSVYIPVSVQVIFILNEFIFINIIKY